MSGPNSSAGNDPEFLTQLEAALGNDYRVERLIGQGGFGRVYSATDVRLGRSVAIKVIRPDLAGARAFVDRFRSEGTALAKFRHPGIVPIYDIREHEGLIYYVMPLIEGETVRAKLEKRGRLSPKETQRILIELCDCLAATHRGGIVHRDIKPDNVILEGAALGKALLMDFGIAKTVRELEESTGGVLMGTPTYMSPEQVSGDSILDHRSDIYSVGVMAYQMLTGKPPFQGGSAHAVLAGHITDRPEPIRKRHPSVPREMADAVERCLEKNPDDRFQSAAELSAALQSVVFASDVALDEPPPANYAMPFFAGLSVECAAFAALGIHPVFIALSSSELWYLAGTFGVLAGLLSPVARAATDPLDGELRDWFRRTFRRKVKP
ncbi:MAG TPA: serine/threonine-protein kinase [Gemmatimonadaceae bacterium]